MRYLFKWNGEPVGFIDDGGELFDTLGRYLGDVDRNGTAWCNDGQYLGQLVDGEYILRNVLALPPPARSFKALQPTPSELPPLPPARTPRAPLAGWMDPFDSPHERPGTAPRKPAPSTPRGDKVRTAPSAGKS